MIEVLVRVTGQDRPLVWRPDPVVGWWHIPGSSLRWTEEGDGWVEINSLGIRDPERSLEKPPGTLRIAVFGDSMTEGVQVNVDQTFTQLLERRLRERLGRPVEVLNFGVNGYSPLQGYLLYRTRGRQFEPDLIIHAVLTDNDVADLHEALTLGQRGAPFVIDGNDPELRVDYSGAVQSNEDYNREPVATLRRGSAVCRLASHVRQRRLAEASAQANRSQGKGIARRFLLYANPPGEHWEAAWARLEKVLRTFAAEAQQNGSRYVVVSVPAGQVVNDEAWALTKADFPETPSYEWDLLSAETRLERLASSLNLEFIAPLQRFRKAPNRLDAFFGRVGHFTPAGHEIMAGVLEDELLARALLP